MLIGTLIELLEPLSAPEVSAAGPATDDEA